MGRRLPLFLIGVCFLACVPDMRADDYDTARNHRLAILAGPSTFDTSDSAISAQLTSIAGTAQGYLNTMETGTSRTELWTDLTFPTGTPNRLSAHMTSTYGRLKAMAQAYATHGCSLQGNSSLLAAITDGLTWMNSNIYNSSASQVGNCWDWQIGTQAQIAVHMDSCTGELLAKVPLQPAYRKDGVITLPAVSFRRQTGQHDMCFAAEGSDAATVWVLNYIQPMLR
jgi:Polysaccharide lyase family 8, N terminal alpha-helical domain